MEKILELAKKVVDEAEVYHCEEDFNLVWLENSKPCDILGSIQSGYALRIIKDGNLGSAYTKNLIDREGFVKNALDSLIGNVKADFNFPGPSKVPEIKQYDEKIESYGYFELMEASNNAIDFFNKRIEGQLDCYAGTIRKKWRIKNSHGLDHHSRSTKFFISPQLVFPNTRTSIVTNYEFLGPHGLPQDDLNKQSELYKASLHEVDVGSKKMQAIFLPYPIQGLLWRFKTAANGKHFHEKNSPILENLSEKIVSEKVTIYNDPHDSMFPGARAFDDEGIPTRRLDIISEGIFENIYVDLDYAKKLGMEPTGTGFRQTVWGGDEITIAPHPNLGHLRIAPGKHSYDELLDSIDEGVIVFSTIGEHSGNILNGDFSFGLDPGLYVKNGEILGRVKDGMVAGNVYDLFNNVIDIENKIHEPNGIPYPCILFDNVSVTAK